MNLNNFITNLILSSRRRIFVRFESIGENQDKQSTIVQLFVIRSLERRNQKYREWLIFEKKNYDTIKETVLIADADHSYSPVIAQDHFVIGWECHEFSYRIPRDMSRSKCFHSYNTTFFVSLWWVEKWFLNSYMELK